MVLESGSSQDRAKDRRWHRALPHGSAQVGRGAGVQTRDHKAVLNRHKAKCPRRTEEGVVGLSVPSRRSMGRILLADVSGHSTPKEAWSKGPEIGEHKAEEEAVGAGGARPRAMPGGLSIRSTAGSLRRGQEGVSTCRTSLSFSAYISQMPLTEFCEQLRLTRDSIKSAVLPLILLKPITTCLSCMPPHTPTTCLADFSDSSLRQGRGKDKLYPHG